MRARAWIWSNDEKNRRHSPHRDWHFKWHRRQTTASSDPAWSAIVELWQEATTSCREKAINRPRQSANRRTKKCHYLELKLMHEKKTTKKEKFTFFQHCHVIENSLLLDIYTPSGDSDDDNGRKSWWGLNFSDFSHSTLPHGISCENLNSTSSHFSCSACAWENEFYFFRFHITPFTLRWICYTNDNIGEWSRILSGIENVKMSII